MSRYLPAPTTVEDATAPTTSTTTPCSPSQIMASKRYRWAGGLVVLGALYWLFLGAPLAGSSTSIAPAAPPPVIPSPGQEVDWSRFAYTQYVTNSEYLCNSVMIFESLHRLGSRADRVMMYPSRMLEKGEDATTDARLLVKARDEYKVKLVPITVQHRQGADSK